MKSYRGLPLIQEIPFNHKGKDFSVRIFSDGMEILVKAFEGEKVADGYSYSISFEMKFQLGDFVEKAVEDFVEEAMRNVKEDKYAELLRIKKELGM